MFMILKFNQILCIMYWPGCSRIVRTKPLAFDVVCGVCGMRGERWGCGAGGRRGVRGRWRRGSIARAPPRPAPACYTSAAAAFTWNNIKQFHWDFFNASWNRTKLIHRLVTITKFTLKFAIFATCCRNCCLVTKYKRGVVYLSDPLNDW